MVHYLDAENLSDEIISEKAFCRPVESNPVPNLTLAKSDQRKCAVIADSDHQEPDTSTALTSLSAPASQNVASGATPEYNDTHQFQAQKKEVHHIRQADGSGAAPILSARAQRRLRREARSVDDSCSSSSSPALRKSMGTKKKRNACNEVTNCSKKTKSNDEVIEVKMLTGTLYLYRGLNRRAEFVRRC